ncbi:thiamine phosphate synthase [Chitinimonas sp.]|uniref:thiamine phosphate synthase n=1 Tax=Chitinimonas sp. TaxID=1934313 RepID=UPI002F93EABA
MSPTLPRGLYAITPDWNNTEQLLAAVSAVLDGGAKVLQYRNKRADKHLRREQAGALLALCRPRGVPLIINDHLDLAEAIDADGLHLGGDDGALAEARAVLGPAKHLGASCYNQLLLAETALAEGASYVAFGAAYVSGTKPDAVQAPLALYKAATTSLPCPVVAIGGITPANAGVLLAAGVGNLAVIGALFDAAAPSERAAEFSRLWPAA